ncbi:hypothetical protein EKH79_13640 [Dyella dinghuensis]|jgi:hypothetical protein|uniref:Uncharacterized protein n=1 Tax=Dyella dinghuensis TaxID=1920169 RepID=A0A3S0RDU3_9GAMM|nr:hypothetical protein [Dyella dinghuensis]RUL63427.1 hypothetical protein EKH79_13640 [Dyella dinghuensis]
MVLAQQLDATELDALTRIAEGRGSTVSNHVASRLLTVGLVTHMDCVAASHARLELTSAGLAVIRSSDQ